MADEWGELETLAPSELLAAAGHRLDAFVAGLDDAPAQRPADAELLHSFLAPPGEPPGELGALLDTVTTAANMGVETAGPRYLGYIPGGGVVSSAVGELVARVVNRFTGLADLAPGLVALEDGVLRWAASVFGLSAGANGVLTTGGSQAMLSMMLAAREARFSCGDLFRARIYLSDQAHHCVRKAARVAGFPASAVHLVPTGDGRRLDPAAVAAAVATDRAAGLRPFLLVGTAGTTNTGAVDPLDALAELARREDLWYHVDGCYGGFFQLTARGRARFTGIERADSVSLDPHKSLFLPYGSGMLLLRDPGCLAAAYSEGSESTDYLQDVPATDLPDYAELTAELTREPRGLRIWLPLHLHGIAAFRAALDEKLDLAAHLYDGLAELPQVELLDYPDLSTVVFRMQGGDDANRALHERINETGRVFCSSTRLDGRFALRFCVLSFRTHRKHVDDVVDVVRAHLA